MTSLSSVTIDSKGKLVFSRSFSLSCLRQWLRDTCGTHAKRGAAILQQLRSTERNRLRSVAQRIITRPTSFTLLNKLRQVFHCFDSVCNPFVFIWKILTPQRDRKREEKKSHRWFYKNAQFLLIFYAARFQNFFNSSGDGSGCKLVTTPVPTVLFSASRNVNRAPFSKT